VKSRDVVTTWRGGEMLNLEIGDSRDWASEPLEYFVCISLARQIFVALKPK
jgi:hypothetical protein